MNLLKTPVEIETAFNVYQLTEQIGEGGAGRVYGGSDADNQPIALKLLTSTSTEKRRRFKNEINFLSRNRHGNIVTVTDHGVGTASALKGPFYVMRRYVGSARVSIGKLEPDAALALFGKILDGVEAAHLLGVTHRDLKPENILLDASGDPAIADFGIAAFTEDQLHTLVETRPTTRLANFQYAAPEQRTPGRGVTQMADIYALGLMLNEFFTGEVPHGTDYRPIAANFPQFEFLDPIVGAMIRQGASERPASIAAVKEMIERHRSAAVYRQKISRLEKIVIPAGEIDDALAHEPPKLVGADWNGGILSLRLDRPVHQEWVQALYGMGNYASIMGAGPGAFRFNGDTASVSIAHNSAQMAIDYFKTWLPIATQTLHAALSRQKQNEEAERRERLRRELAAERQRQQVNTSLRI